MSPRRPAWVTDDRPPSVYTRLYIWGMRLNRDKQAFEGEAHTRQVAEDKQRRGNRSPTSWTRLTRRVGRTERQGMTVWSVSPRRHRPRARVVYVHGGGYIHPLTADYWRLARALAGAPAEVVVPAYPLAPGATVDEVLPRLVELVEGLARDGEELPIVLMGDSAGGALVLTMAAQLRERGSALPVGVVALSPWLDAALRDEEVGRVEPTDPMLAASGLRAAGRWWAGVRDVTDPLVSPVDLDLEGLAPLDVFIGDRDILRPAVDRLAESASTASVDLRVHELTAMFHVWMTRAIPEGRRTRQELVEIVRERCEV